MGTDDRRCRWDGTVLDYTPPGRPPVWCSTGCREAHRQALGTLEPSPFVLVDQDDDAFEVPALHPPGGWLEAARQIAGALGRPTHAIKILRPGTRKTSVPIYDGNSWHQPKRDQS